MAPERKFDHDEARRLRAEGYSVLEIAELFNVTKGAVSHVTADAIRQATDKASPEAARKRREANPETFTEMRDLAAKEVWTNFKSLKGVAQIQAFNAIRDLAKQEPDGGEAEPEPLIADVVSGVASLSPLRKVEILSVERERLVVEMAAIDAVLAELEVVAT